MSFLDHLEELRWHLIRSLAVVLVVMVAALFNKRLLFHYIILGPSRPDFITYKMLCRLGQRLGVPDLCIEKLDFILQSRTMTGQFTTHLTVSIIAGLVVAFPYVFWEMWRFIKPGLYEREQKMTRGAVLFVSFLFFAGISFGYFLVAPLSVNFLANYKVDESIANEFDLTSYMGLLVMITLACGLMFQLPMVVYVLSKVGIATPGLMRRFRRHAIVAIFIIAAILTPSPDVFSQMLLAIPIYVLYEFSIVLSARVERQRLKELS